MHSQRWVAQRTMAGAVLVTAVALVLGAGLTARPVAAGDKKDAPPDLTGVWTLDEAHSESLQKVMASRMGGGPGGRPPMGGPGGGGPPGGGMGGGPPMGGAGGGPPGGDMGDGPDDMMGGGPGGGPRGMDPSQDPSFGALARPP